ncbi:AraC family transcriptional regulator [Streptomyces sp. NBC_01275]|uniref:AraC family transcriptional regulator n=1 Tax=Streptomyces sp. NBC_01275 TaxID=2903807 RepID=UPI00224E5968|nr:AraC family transcriptional regulator [Streptomyces sp. NBC_01275]MCX4764427.1 AraC family transcriptional regulator [Streptomyces sp. NBC_01275]
MDLVSDAISSVRTGLPHSNRLSVSGSWCTRLAAYEGAGFHVVLAGVCWLLPEGGGAWLRLGAGDVVLLPHGAEHVLADAPVDAATAARAAPFEDAERPAGPTDAVGDVELLCGKYRLDRSRTHPLLAELPQVVHLPNRADRPAELRAAVDLLAGELDGRRPGSALALPSLLDLLLVYMVRAWLARAATGAWPAVLGDPVATAALRALHSDPAAPWTADRLAARAGVSRATLSRRFTALVGRPPMAYLTWWRLTLAAARLRDSDAPLATVAREAGYGSPYALSHAFSREFGTTPGRFRAGRPSGSRSPSAPPPGPAR